MKHSSSVYLEAQIFNRIDVVSVRKSAAKMTNSKLFLAIPITNFILNAYVKSKK